MPDQRSYISKLLEAEAMNARLRRLACDLILEIQHAKEELDRVMTPRSEHSAEKRPP
jgi:hypothetical protein